MSKFRTFVSLDWLQDKIEELKSIYWIKTTSKLLRELIELEYMIQNHNKVKNELLLLNNK